MILSVSRRTDIPAFYSKWFMNRVREGYVYTRNPMNYHAISNISLSPDVIDCIVFWTKNVEPMLEYLPELSEKYMYYFQYTLNAYLKDLEPCLPKLQDKIETFKKLSLAIGKDRVIWRYDPIILTEKYDVNWHIRAFTYISNELKDYTNVCVFSFVDMYDKVIGNMKEVDAIPITKEAMERIADSFSKIAQEKGITLKTCCEEIDLEKYNIEHSCCIDPVLMAKLLNCNLKTKKDSNQRGVCGCVESVDIGQYNTCRNGCKYCYANYSVQSVINNSQKHNEQSSLLIGNIESDDKITERKMKSLINGQIGIFD